jgi:hypothetical protein
MGDDAQRQESQRQEQNPCSSAKRASLKCIEDNYEAVKKQSSQGAWDCEEAPARRATAQGWQQ